MAVTATLAILSSLAPLQVDATTSGEMRRSEIVSRINALLSATTTPRQTVESLIAVGNLRSELSCYDQERGRSDPANRSRDALELSYASSYFSGDALASALRYRSQVRDLQSCLRSRHVQTIEIVDVDVSDPSQVVVQGRIRNLTHIPSSISLTPEYARKRADGEVYRYSLVRATNGWRVRQAYRYDQYAENGLRPAYEAGDPFHVAYWYTAPD